LPSVPGLDLAALLVHRLNVRLAEDHEQVARAGLLEQFVAHRQIGVVHGLRVGELTLMCCLYRGRGLARSGSAGSPSGSLSDAPPGTSP